MLFMTLFSFVSPLSVEQGIFLCAIGASYILLFYVIAFVLFLAFSGAVTVLRLTVSINKPRKISRLMSFMFFVVQYVMLTVTGPFISLCFSFVAIIFLMATSSPSHKWDSYKSLMPIACAIIPAILFSSGTLLDDAQLSILSGRLFSGSVSSAIAAIILTVRGNRPLTQSYLSLRACIIITGAISVAFFGIHRTYASVTIALFCLIASWMNNNSIA